MSTPERLKILFLGLNYLPEQVGIGPYSGDMTRDWVQRGHRVEAVVAHPYYPAWRTFTGFGGGWRHTFEDGVGVSRCPIYVPAMPSGGKRIAHHLSFATASFAPIMRRAAAMRPDLVFAVAPSLIAAPVARLAACLFGKKSWLHIQDFEIEAAFATGLMAEKGFAARTAARFEARTMRGFDMVSTISAQMCAKLGDKGVARPRIYQLRNWADVDAIRPIDFASPYRAEWGITTPHVALYSGNIANKQGIGIVLEAARILRDREDLTFIVCGEGPNRAQLVASAAGLPNIRFYDLQPRDRLGDLLSMATVHLLPQVAGAADLVLPSKLTNMLASGRPVVATAMAGTGLAQEVEGCGIVTAPGSAHDMVAAIVALLDDPELGNALGAKARKRAEYHWGREAIMAGLSNRMVDLCRSTGPR